MKVYEQLLLIYGYYCIDNTNSKEFSTSLQRYKKIGISYDGVRGIGYLYAHYNPKV